MRTHRARIEAPDPASLNTAPYCTWIEARHPTIKMHPNIGQAKSALTGGCWDGYADEAYGNGFLYEYVPGEGWKLAHSIHPGDRKSVHPLWNQYMIPEYEEPIDWQKKIRSKSKKAS